MAQRLVTERLVLRPWTPDDAEAALAAYGDAEVAKWLAPEMDTVPDPSAMRLVLQQWVAEDARLLTPAPGWPAEQHTRQAEVRRTLLTSPLLVSAELPYGSGMILATRCVT